MKPSEAVKVLRNSGLRGESLLALLDSIVPTIQQDDTTKDSVTAPGTSHAASTASSGRGSVSNSEEQSWVEMF